MEKLPSVVVPAGQSVLFEPGAKHLMLRYPETTPHQVTLQFFSGEDLLLAATTIVAED
jgi:copper(I)-binding protein